MGKAGNMHPFIHSILICVQLTFDEDPNMGNADRVLRWRRPSGSECSVAARRDGRF